MTKEEQIIKVIVEYQTKPKKKEFSLEDTVPEEMWNIEYEIRDIPLVDYYEFFKN